MKKKVLIIGQNSYIGNSFKQYLEKQQVNTSDGVVTENVEDERKQFACKVELEVETVGASNGAWKQADFSKYNVILHTAAIVHQKET